MIKTEGINDSIFSEINPVIFSNKPTNEYPTDYLHFFQKPDGKWGMEDSEGNVLLDDCDKVEGKYYFIAFEKEGKCGFYNLITKRLIGKPYDKLYEFEVSDLDEDYETYNDKYLLCQVGKKFRTYDLVKDYESKFSYDDVGPFVNGVGIVRIEDKWAVANINGDYMWHPIYSSAIRFHKRFFLLNDCILGAENGDVVMEKFYDYKTKWTKVVPIYYGDEIIVRIAEFDSKGKVTKVSYYQRKGNQLISDDSLRWKFEEKYDTFIEDIE